MAGPGCLCKRLGRYKLAGFPVDHVEEPVLGCMQQRLDLPTVDIEVGEYDVHIGVVVPGFSRRRLVVPAVFACAAIQRYY